MIFPGKKFISISQKNFGYLPLKSTMKGLLFELDVLRTRTAFPVGDVVVAGTVAVVTSGTDVGAKQSKPLQGHPVEQFS